jgi:hypothetical protein
MVTLGPRGPEAARETDVGDPAILFDRCGSEMDLTCGYGDLCRGEDRPRACAHRAPEKEWFEDRGMRGSRGSGRDGR